MVVTLAVIHIHIVVSLGLICFTVWGCLLFDLLGVVLCCSCLL
jgi:hypothetical protein